jgi:ankyrin repeat protein
MKCLELVLEHEADVNNKAKDGTPVFMLACETSNENEEMCLKLLEKGSDPLSKTEVSVWGLYIRLLSVALV